MTQIVQYSENNITYKEGPFVLCQIGNQYRIEVEFKDWHTSVIPGSSIYYCLDYYQLDTATDKETRSEIVDFLNWLVLEKEIYLEGKTWVWKKPAFHKG